MYDIAKTTGTANCTRATDEGTVNLKLRVVLWCCVRISGFGSPSGKPPVCSIDVPAGFTRDEKASILKAVAR